MTATGKLRQVIAIDGPAAAGKTTVARALAARLGAIFLDTGLLYRAVTLSALQRGIPATDEAAIAGLVRSLRIDVRTPSIADGRALDVLVDGEDVTSRLRTPEVDRSVSAVSALPAVRQALLPIQRELAERGPAVMVGRDIASVVVPDAGVKIYLDASDEERARRRYEELRARGSTQSYDDVLRDLIARDRADSSRESSPLTLDPDAVVIDSDGKSIRDVVDEIAAIVLGRWNPTAARLHEAQAE